MFVPDRNQPRDILIEGDDTLGDGVNVAGICISSSAYDQVRGKVPVEFTDLGEQASRKSPVRCMPMRLV